MAKPRKFRPTYLRQWRHHRGLTLERLAGRLDMTASHLSMLERGQRGYTQDTLEALARALQTDQVEQVVTIELLEILEAEHGVLLSGRRGDVLSVGIWLVSFCGRTVRWYGQSFTIDHQGRLHRTTS